MVLDDIILYFETGRIKKIVSRIVLKKKKKHDKNNYSYSMFTTVALRAVLEETVYFV